MNEKEILRLILSTFVQVKIDLSETTISPEAGKVKKDIEDKFQNFKNWANLKINDL